MDLKFAAVKPEAAVAEEQLPAAAAAISVVILWLQLSSAGCLLSWSIDLSVSARI